MVNNELDRQKGNIQEEHHYLIYIIIGLLLFTFILIILLYVMYRCNSDLNKAHIRRVMESEESRKNKYDLENLNSKSTFYDYEIRESPIIKQSNLRTYDIQGPIVQDKSCGGKDILVDKGNPIEQITDTPDRLSINTLPPIINK